MPNKAIITLTDRGATAHTFAPQKDEPNDVYRFSEASASGVKIADSHLRVSTRKSGSNYKVRLKLEVPVVQTETINGIDNPKVVRVGIADATFTFADRSLPAERELVIGLMADALAADQTELNAVLKDLESFY